jgi:5-methyltetrahydropteroyltriglutamate--homocysteine methyltransferase
MLQPLTAQIVGSYAKPHWLAHHQRMRALDGSFWRPDAEVLQEAREDAARLALYEQERAGLDLVTDGEQQRAVYDRHFLPSLTGIDTSELAPVGMGGPTEVTTVRRRSTGNEEMNRLSAIGPTVTGAISWTGSAAAAEIAFARKLATKPLKATVIGPVTLSRSLANRHYEDESALVLALADALNHECRAVEQAGAAVIQIDEPSFHSRFSLARRVGLDALGRMVRGVGVPVQVHVCYGYAIAFPEKTPSEHYADVLRLLARCPIAGISLEYEQPGHTPEILAACGDKHVIPGLLDLGRTEPESVDHIAARLESALEVVPAARLHPSSDCGLWHLPRAAAYAKIAALAAATHRVRAARI